MILSAAILSPTSVPYPGLRHAEIVKEIIMTEGVVPSEPTWSFGFITSAGDFVDRKVAMEVAEHYGQLQWDNGMRELMSEDIY